MKGGNYMFRRRYYRRGYSSLYESYLFVKVLEEKARFEALPMEIKRPVYEKHTEQVSKEINTSVAILFALLAIPLIIGGFVMLSEFFGTEIFMIAIIIGICLVTFIYMKISNNKKRGE